MARVPSAVLRLVVVVGLLAAYAWRYADWFCDVLILSRYRLYHYAGVWRVDQDLSDLDRITNGPEIVPESGLRRESLRWGYLRWKSSDGAEHWYGPCWDPYPEILAPIMRQISETTGRWT